jgi:tetratricopeptide (TPR) repeat protein
MIAMAQVGRHNENAAIEAERAITHFDSNVAIFLGVAGGVHGVAIGDVVAATKVYGYEAGKAKKEFLPTPEVYRSSHAMEQRAMAVARNEDWLKRIKRSIHDPVPKAFVEPIAAGPKVVKSTRSATYKFLSSNYSDAVAVEMEGLGFLAAAHANSKVCALVVRGISDLLDHKEDADASGSQEIASQNAAAFAFEILARLDLEEKKDPQKPLIENIPFHQNPNFTGRNSVLDELHRNLTAAHYAVSTQAIIGLGGVGKTQLALEYAYRHLDYYHAIWWVRSEETATLAEDYASLAVKLELLKDIDEIDARIQATWSWLEDNARWLLIFDNVQKPDDLNNYLPRIGSGHVIITSRIPNWESLAKSIEVLEFERRESIEFLLKRTGLDDEKNADILAENLGGLPLALEQAAAYIKGAGKTFDSYLKLLQKEGPNILKTGKPFNYPKPVASTWNISVESARRDTPESVDLLNLCSFLAPDQIPRFLLIKGAENISEPLASVVKDEKMLDKVLASLRLYSLIGYFGKGFYIHRMVQAVTRDQLSEDHQKKWARAATMMVDRAFPKYQPDNVESWDEFNYLLPHALAASGHAKELGVASYATGHLLNEAGMYLRIRGDFYEAKSALEVALKIDEKIFGPDHPNVARDVNNLGRILRDLGDFKEARKCQERALKIDEKIFGPDHPNVARDVNNLGRILRDLGDFKEARKCQERALKIDEKIFGPDHPNVARDINNLGRTLHKLGDFKEARKCQERALKIDEKVFGPDHPNVAAIVDNLGVILRDLGDLQEARKCLERALKIGEMVFGSDHPNVATIVNNLGRTMQKLGDIHEARRCYERALKIDEKIFGPDHPNVARDVNNLGVVLRDLGDLQEARKCLERALEIFRTGLGDANLRTRTAESNLKSLGEA